jgi:excisionase family DNA binding protein
MKADNEDKERLLTIQEVSELTHLAVGTLYHLVSQQRIPVVRFSRRCIRFRLSKLKQWFEELTQEAAETTVMNNKRKPYPEKETISCR